MFKQREIHRNYWEWVPDENTKVLLFDIETNGLIDQTTKIHCICAKDFLTKEVFSFGPNQMEEARACLDSYDTLVAHNGLCFDVPVLEKLWGRSYRCFDTLTASRLIWTDLADYDFGLIRRKLPVEFPKKLIGRHSLKAWGYRLGCYKGDYGETTENAWENWSQEMQDYCEQDVEVLEKLYRHILDQRYAKEAMALEHEFQKVIFNQERVGVHFDKAKAVELYSGLASDRDSIFRELQEEFPPNKVTEVFVPKRNNSVKGYIKGVPIERVSYLPFNPGSREQIAERLVGLGWTPSVFTETGQPTVDEHILAGLSYPCCKKLIRYLELTKIIGMVGEGNAAWLRLCTADSRIHGRVITNGAVTGRCTHNSPNLAQIPARGGFGHQCRELFCADPESPMSMMMGCDASGLELRMLSSYMSRYDGGKYAQTILEGDIHTANQEAAGLPTRNDAKTFIYALMYGAGDAKLGSIVDPTGTEQSQARKGKLLREKFYKNIPALKRLTEDVQAAAKKRKFLIGVDGRRLYIRSQHSALNTLLQSAGAVMMKYATVLFHEFAHEAGFVLGRDYIQVLHVHDEFQINCRPEIVDQLGELAVKSIEAAGRHFGLPCPTTGEYKKGSSWADTH